MVLNLYSGLFLTTTAIYKVQRGITKIHNQELWFLHSARRRICMKFYEDERL